MFLQKTALGFHKPEEIFSPSNRPVPNVEMSADAETGVVSTRK
jgi:hypothetical protein